MVEHGGSSGSSYLADPTSPSPPTVHQLLRLALQELRWKEGSIDLGILPPKVDG